MPSLWNSLADLRVRIDDYSVRAARARGLDSFTRVTTTVVLARRRRDRRGRGRHLHRRRTTTTFPTSEMLAGTWSLHDYSVRLDELELFDAEPQMAASRDYRRWAFESAALDLALRQAGRVARRRPRACRTGRSLRRVDARRDRAVPRAEPGARVQARRGGGLGSRADGATRRDRSRARPRPEGVLPRHRRSTSRPIPSSTASSPSASPTS